VEEFKEENKIKISQQQTLHEDKKTLLMYQLALFNAVNARIEGAFMEVPRPSFRPK
jgi:hypothetical protein